MVSGIVIQAVPIFGSSTDLTVGLFDANRGEYLLAEDPERTVGVTLGLKLKFGSNGEKKQGFAGWCHRIRMKIPVP